MVSNKEQKEKALKIALMNYFDKDVSKVKQLVEDCKSIGLPIGDNIDAIMENNEAFQTVIMLSHLGTISKLTEVLNIIKGSPNGK